jgi:hypothetical protein
LPENTWIWRWPSANASGNLPTLYPLPTRPFTENFPDLGLCPGARRRSWKGYRRSGPDRLLDRHLFGEGNSTDLLSSYLLKTRSFSRHK